MKVKIAWEFPMSTGFFNMEAKKIPPLVTLSREPDFMMDWRRVAIAGRERKHARGAFKAQKSGRKAGIGPAAPFVTLAAEKRNVQFPNLCLLSRMLYGLPIVPD
jgi:hypothetical protein